MILPDTNICIYTINARPPAVLARFHQHRLGEIGTSSVAAAELAHGVAKSGSPRNLEALEMLLAPFASCLSTKLPSGPMALRVPAFNAEVSPLARLTR